MMRQATGFLFLGGLLLTSLPACDSGASFADTPATAPTVQQSSPTQSQAGMPPIATASTIKADRVKSAIAAVLQAHYSEGYDDATRCWHTDRGEGDEATAYCMRPLPEQVVRQGDTTWVYMALASASDIRNNPDYLYGQVDPGVMDAFKLRIAADGTTEVVARGLGLPFGSAGDCGCTNAEFVQVGPRTHGWMFTSGGTWQGTTVASHALVAPVGDTFKDVAALPRYVEGDQSAEYRLAIAPAPTGDWYPLELSYWRDGKKARETQIAFDPDSARYDAPDAL